MNLSFSKEIAEGDIIVISLCSFYINVQQLPTSDNLGQVELINIDIIRENAKSVVSIGALGDICRTLIKILDDTPNAVAYYFCDYMSEVPLMRKRNVESVQSYRNKLFKMLFERFSQLSNDKWKDREVIIENVDSGNLFAHLIYRDRHKSIIDALVSEILDDSEIILSPK